ncbi:MAG: transposase, partial [Candidatus Krumholzibacteriia bacterium]
MSRATSPSSGERYGVVRVVEEFAGCRSTYYARRKREAEADHKPSKRGPKTKLSDEELEKGIREVLEASPFLGEGYRKVWAKLRVAGVRVGKERVRRIMREAGLQAPYRAARNLGPHVHDGTITTEKPDEMWGTDLTATATVEEGQASVFIAVDHCTGECVGIHAAREANRFEALEPIRQGVREHFGGYEEKIAVGLKLRHDHGSQYMSDDFQQEIRFLGIESSPAFVRAPEGNGKKERSMRDIKSYEHAMGRLGVSSSLSERIKAAVGDL